jgi:hypothetical protein
MAHNRGNQQYSQHPQYPQSGPPLPPLPQDANRTDDGTTPTTSPSGYSTNGPTYTDYTYASAQTPTWTLGGALRPAQELLTPASTGQPLPPTPHRLNSSLAPMSSTSGPMSPYSPNSPSSYSQSGYNPQDYANPISSASAASSTSPLQRRPVQQQQYNPADYASPGMAQTGSPAAYQHGFSPGYSPSSHGVPLPGMASYPPPRPSSLINSRPSLHTSYSSHYASTAPPPLPTIPSAGAQQSDDWGRLPGMTRYTSIRNQQLPSEQPPPLPTPYGRTGSADYLNSPLTHSTSPAGIPPPPPPHSGLGRSDTVSRPLPRLPSHDSQDDYSEQSAVGARDEHKVQEELENEIMASIGGTPSPRPRVSHAF